MKKCIISFLIQLILIYLLASCTATGTFFYPGLKGFDDTTSRRIIHTVKIGDQIWTAKNLDVDKYSNGDTIPYVQDAEKWSNLKTGAWCYYFNNELIDPAVGKLYNWYAVNDPRGLAPEGWRVPTEEDWELLIDSLGGKKNAGKKMKEKGTEHWMLLNKNVTNESGFTALPNGKRNESGNFIQAPNAFFWTSTPTVKSKAKGLLLISKTTSPPYLKEVTTKSFYQNEGLGVRLICSNDSCNPISYNVCATEDQKNYGTIEPVKIGSQVWMNKNLEVDHYRNGDPIPQVQDPKVWNKLKTGAWCYDISICKYGFQVSKLYNWYAVNDPRGLAPEGWHIPTDVECTTLISYLGGKKMALDKLKETGIIHWAGIDKSVTNEIGFTAIPYGIRSSHGKFYYPNTHAAYWTESQYSKTHAYSFNIEQYADYIGISEKYNKNNGLSVRCILD